MSDVKNGASKPGARPTEPVREDTTLPGFGVPSEVRAALPADPKDPRSGDDATLIDPSPAGANALPSGAETKPTAPAVNTPKPESRVLPPTVAGTPVAKQIEGAVEALSPSAETTIPREESSAIAEAIADSVGAPGIVAQVCGKTDVGLVREHNEDNFLIANLTEQKRGDDPAVRAHTVGPRGSLFAVCDGMGGAAAGEVASQMAVDSLFNLMSAHDAPPDRDTFARRLVRAVEDAGARISAAAKSDRSMSGMGTTATVAGLIDRMLFVAQVGDSRGYVLRGKDFRRITKDQSLLERLLDSGHLAPEDVERFESTNVILQALGTMPTVEVDLTFLELVRGDRLLLCSDGLSGLVHEDVMKDALLKHRDREQCCARLIELARNGGGTDNITAVIVDFNGDDLPTPEVPPPVAYQQYPLPLDARDGKSTPDDSTKVPHPPAPSPPSARPSREVAPPSRGRWIIALLIALLGAVALVLLFGRSAADRATNTVIIRTPIAGGAELVVDHGGVVPLRANVDHRLELPRGTHRFELRQAGTTIAVRVIMVDAPGQQIILDRDP